MTVAGAPVTWIMAAPAAGMTAVSESIARRVVNVRPGCWHDW